MAPSNPPDDPFQQFMSPGLRELTQPEPRSGLESLVRFRRALRKEDQDALDDLLTAATRLGHLRDEAPHLTPLEFMLIALLIEEHALLLNLRSRLDQLAAASPSA